MTREEIINMPAGSELDTLIAQRIIGLPLIEFSVAPCPYCGDEMRFCGARSWCSTCHEWRHSSYKCYSDEIEAAWRVIEKMEEKGLNCWSVRNHPKDNLVDCSFDFLDTVNFARAEADTAPLAICRAALLATLE